MTYTLRWYSSRGRGVFFGRNGGMTAGTKTITVPLGSNGKRIVLKHEELLFLHELTIHRTLQVRDVYDFFRNVFRIAPHTKSIAKRLGRLVSAGILMRMEERVNPTNLKTYYYKIGKRGLEALHKSNLISRDDAERLYQQIFYLKIPKSHTMAASHLANQTKVLGLSEDLALEHNRGIDDPELKKKGNVLISDWVFKRRNRTVFLEVDSGRQTLEVISSKVERYIHFAETVNENVVLVFSVMDDTVSKSFTSDRSKRIASLKENMSPCQNWPKNFSIYVITAERTPELILRILKRSEPLSQEFRGYVIDEWIEQLKGRTKGKFEIQDLAKETAYGSDRVKELEADFTLQLNEATRTRYIALIYAEEGNVQTYQRIRYNHHRTKGTLIHGQRLDELIMVYKDKDFMSSEVHGVFWENSWYTFRDTWRLSEDQIGSYPEMLKPISQFRREWNRFE